MGNEHLKQVICRNTNHVDLIPSDLQADLWTSLKEGATDLARLKGAQEQEGNSSLQEFVWWETHPLSTECEIHLLSKGLCPLCGEGICYGFHNVGCMVAQLFPP